MSFGFGGFGQNNQSSGFGAGSGFGASSSGGGFGTQNQSNPLFGGQNRPASSGFGSPATSTGGGGGLFGSGTTGATTGGTGFGGFGAGNTGGGFGSSGGGLFGNKPAATGGFGAGTGGFGSSGGGFGAGTAAPATGTGFGGGTGTAFQQQVPPSDGTATTPFSPFTEKDNSSNVTNHYQSISFMQPYNKYSFEELRLGDYNQGRRYGNGSGQAGAFGNSAFGAGGGTGFGAAAAQPAAGGFGAAASSTPFGGAGTSAAPSGFGSTPTAGAGGFGSTGGNSLFGAAKPATSLFGGGAAAGTATSQPGGSLFGGGGTATTGGFGSSTGAGTGGGFGAGGSLFGGNNNQQQQQQNKPLFGGGAGAAGGTGTGFGGFGGAQTSSAAGPFGGTAATTTPFGQNQQTGTGGGFGGFGQNQNQTQNKGGLFGGGGGFGAGAQPQQQQQPAAGSSLFGGGAGAGAGAGTGGSSLFGGQTQQQPQQQGAGSSLFGGGAAQQPAAGGSSLFGGGAQQQQKPGGLFGSSTPAAGTGSSPFGGFGNNQGQTGGGSSLFGGGAAAQPQQQKPSLFGGGTGGGSSLFGGGQSTAAPGGGGSSLFGGSQAQQPQAGGGLGGSSLFGNSQATQQQQQSQQPAPGSLQASLLDGNPYGNQSIFSGLPAPSAPSPGPLATPLSSSMKQKQRTPLPVHKITPSASTRLVTPPKRGYGFSYSTYGSPSSTTSTPNGSGLLAGGGGSLRGSLSGLGGAGAGGSFNRSFSKSFSTSNLRKSFDPDTDSVLSPGALTSGSSRLSSGGLKRLTIDRSLRNDLFARPASTSSAPPPITNGGEDSAPPAIERAKKRVSFDSAAQSTVPDGSGGELVASISESPEPTSEELGFLRTIRRSGSVNGLSSKTSFDSLSEQRGSRELASVPEDAVAAPAAASAGATPNGASKLPFNPPGTDPQPGEYWMKPSRAEINKMSRDQQKSFAGLTVGRQHCGQVTFEEPVDLTTIDLDQIFGGLVEIMVRKITVYPDEAIKPPMGKGLNVVSVLRIENSWPRGRDKKAPSALTSGPLFEKHIDRLKKVVNAEFIDYETDSGTWVFRVPHFTTYGLDYDSDEEEEAGEKRLDQSTMSAAPDTPTPKAQRNVNFDDFEPTSTFSTEEDSFVGSIAGVEDDTFDFKKRKLVPGAFGDHGMDMDEQYQQHQRLPVASTNDDEESFLGESSTGSTTEQDIEEDVDVDEDDDATVTESQQSGTSEVGLDEDAAMDMAGSFPTTLHPTVERNASPSTMNSYVRGGSPQPPTLKPWGTPAKARLDLSGDWAEQLQRTISPRKQNRDALREIQGNAFHDRPLDASSSPSKKSPAAGNQPKKSFTNSIDLMNSLFQQQPRKQQQAQKQPTGFEWPYQKQTKSFAGESNELSRDDIAFHHSFKPRWGPMDSVITIKNDMKDTRDIDNGRWEQGITITGEDRDVILLGYNKGPEASEMLEVQKKLSAISRVDGVPFARLAQADFRQFTQVSSASAQAHSDNELLVWQLANVLFNDDLEDDISASVPIQLRQQYASRIKKDRLSRLWEGIVRQKYVYDLERANSDEERAVYLLCSHRVEDACKTLLASRDFRLATLVAQIGRDPTIRNDMAQQIDMWRQHNVYSEMTEPIRAIYELLAGNALSSEGKAGGALEDRASTFSFTERFELDWFQAFGLRLWYATADDEPLEAAVAKFVDDLAHGETAYPSPTSGQGQDRESPLWVLIKMYAATLGHTGSQTSVEFPAALLPESVSGDRLSNRLSFQLYQLLATAVGHEANNGFFQINTEQADKLTWDYAWELSVTNTQLANALFVLLHLSRPADRERAIKDTLARFAPQLPDPVTSDGSPDPTWHSLSTYLQIPESWIWVAKALCARDAGDAAREVDCLIRGKNWNDAHATFVRTVGPTAVIERDYATLETLVSGFGDSPERKVRGWARGGGLYEDFLRLATAKGGRRDSVRLNRLVNALGALGESETVRGSSVEGLEERVAFKEMSKAVALWSASEEAVELSSVLGLPLTGDARLLQTAEMSRRYYGIIMAGAY